MKQLLYSICLFCVCLHTRPVSAQIGMGGQPHPSAVLDLKSPANDKAFYPPRLTTSQRKAIPNPQAGAFVYDTDQSTFYLFDGTYWFPLALQPLGSVAPTTRLASDGVSGDEFGYSVAISGNYALVGAYNKTIGTNGGQGAAYIFIRSGNSWTQQQQLTANDGTPSDFFGRAVAISGDYALVGAPLKNIGAGQQGVVYAFVRSGNSWIQQQRFNASDGANEDFFGGSLAISGDYALIGASLKTMGGNTYQGAAYLFKRVGGNWSQQQKLTASDGSDGDRFGRSVAISGDNLIIGASGKIINNIVQGAAYTFQYRAFGTGAGTYIPRQRLTGGGGDEVFGGSVAISDGNYAVVGASNANSGRGAAYVFIASFSVTQLVSWTQQQKLTASDGVISDSFGASVAISGNYILIGAPDRKGNNETQGAVYLFNRTTASTLPWKELRIISDSSPANTLLGSSIGLSDGSYIIGGTGFQNRQGKVAFGVVEN